MKLQNTKDRDLRITKREKTYFPQRNDYEVNSGHISDYASESFLKSYTFYPLNNHTHTYTYMCTHVHTKQSEPRE